MYTRLRTPPQTVWARHLDAIRQERDWSATKMFEESREALGLAPKSRTAFTSLLVADEPNERQAAVLTRLYGAPDPALQPHDMEKPGPSDDVTGLVVAMTTALLAQAQALTDIRLLLASAAGDAARERAETAELIGRLSVQLDELRVLAGMPSSSVARA